MFFGEPEVALFENVRVEPTLHVLIRETFIEVAGDEVPHVGGHFCESLRLRRTQHVGINVGTDVIDAFQFLALKRALPTRISADFHESSSTWLISPGS